jgi:hypothetical protein
MTLKGILRQIAAADGIKRRSDISLRKTYKAFSSEEAAFRVVVDRMFRAGKVYDFSISRRKRVTRYGRILFTTVMDLAHKPDGHRKRHFNVRFDHRPFVYAYTDMGPGRHFDQEKVYDLDGNGIVNFYRQEILA